MARTPDLAGALEAVVARTLKGTIGPRLRRLEGQLRRLDRKLRKIRAIRRKPGRKPGRKARAAGRGRPRAKMIRASRRGRRARR